MFSFDIKIVVLICRFNWVIKNVKLLKGKKTWQKIAGKKYQGFEPSVSI